MQHRLQWVAALLLLLVLMSSCAPFVRRAAWDLDRVTPAGVRGTIENNFAKLKTLSGKARITFEMPGMAYTGYSNIAMRLPDSVLVKVEAILGIDVGSFFCDSKSFAAYVPSENRVYRGDIQTVTMATFFELDMDHEELMSALAGIMRLPTEGVQVDGVDDGQLLLEAEYAFGDVKLWVDPKYRLVSKAELIDDADEVQYRLAFSRFQKSSGVVLPRMITMERPRQKERLTLFFTSRSVNIDPRKLDLRLRLPSDVEEVFL